MATASRTTRLTGHEEFDELIAEMASSRDAAEADAIEKRLWDRFGIEGAVLISDMASFSSVSREAGVCHYLKMIHRARQVVEPIIAENKGLLLKCDADNCYAFFDSIDDALNASFELNEAIFRANETFASDEHAFLSIGIDYGRVLLIGDIDFFGDPVNTASKLGEDLAIKAETLVTERALARSDYVVPEFAERMVARVSEIEISYVRIPMVEPANGD